MGKDYRAAVPAITGKQRQRGGDARHRSSAEGAQDAVHAYTATKGPHALVTTRRSALTDTGPGTWGAGHLVGSWSRWAGRAGAAERGRGARACLQRLRLYCAGHLAKLCARSDYVMAKIFCVLLDLYFHLFFHKPAAGTPPHQVPQSSRTGRQRPVQAPLCVLVGATRRQSEEQCERWPAPGAAVAHRRSRTPPRLTKAAHPARRATAPVGTGRWCSRKCPAGSR